MFKKIIRVSFYVSLLILIIALLSWLTVRYLLIEKAKEEGAVMIASITKENPDATDDEKIISTTKAVFETFEHKDASDILIYKLRPYLSNRRLPEFIRLPKGVVAGLTREGYCDSASRWLLFLLQQQGFKSVQWNLASPVSSHAALLVTTGDGRKVFVDPYFGYVTVDKNGKLINPYTALNRMKAGASFKEVFKPLGKQSDPYFYRNFTEMTMGAQGEPIVFTTTLPSLKKNPLVLGEINGDAEDVKQAGTAKKLGFYWNYLGHQYSRKWVRVLKVTEPVRITMTLVSEPTAGSLNSIGYPDIDGKKITWNLEPGDDLTFVDGLSYPSWKSFKSYVGVDQLIFEYR